MSNHSGRNIHSEDINNDRCNDLDNYTMEDMDTILPVYHANNPNNVVASSGSEGDENNMGESDSASLEISEEDKLTDVLKTSRKSK